MTENKLEIKFSHDYPKLHGQTTAELLAIKKVEAEDVDANKDLIEYDTKFFVENRAVDDLPYGYYPLPKKGKLIQLIFLGNKGIPFCTLRRYEDKKYNYYWMNIGKIFDIVRTDG